MLSTDALEIQRRGRTIVEPLSLTLSPGQWLMLIGPNGAGKSTLLHTLSGYYPPSAGQIWLHQKPIEQWSLTELAQHRAVLTQQQPSDSPLCVNEVIELGLAPWKQGRKLYPLIAEQAEWLALTPMLKQPYNRLSGGEQQRVQIARVLVQLLAADDLHGHYLFLDEPLTALDLHHQQQLLRKLDQLKRQGLAILCVLHDLNLAALYGDQLLLLQQGRCRYLGDVAAVAEHPLIEQVYQLDACMLSHPQSQQPQWLIRR
ncbi:heme ABC transporter ATP-binding protein [Celerinatantimonas sp. YJH-8]|uniref:heme ABC transporter ATP-binding protein n=1 Tax=Celerinatantimonas sp. YJH-8 TaxID=3228714 RepID=UPI0038BF0EDC